MSTPHVPTNQDILDEINKVVNPSPKNDNKINIGGQEYDASNVQAIQDAINASLTKNQSEFSTLRSELEQLKTGRTIKPEVDNAPPQVQRPPEPTPRKPRVKTDEEWTQDFVKAPQRVLDEYFAGILGMEGSGAEAFRGILSSVGAELQKQQLAQQALLAKAQELDKKITEQEADREARSFLESTPDFENTAETRKVIEEYLTEYSLSPSEKNLKLVYNMAQNEGKINKKQAQVQQDQQPTLRTGVPRLGGQSHSNVDDQYLIDQANKMPLHEHAALIERLKAGNLRP